MPRLLSFMTVYTGLQETSSRNPVWILDLWPKLRNAGFAAWARGAHNTVRPGAGICYDTGSVS